MPKAKRIPDIAIEIDITTESSLWSDCSFELEDTVRDAVLAAVENSKVSETLKDRTAEIGIVLADDEFVRTLNRDYRKKDSPTNVLSFPQTDFSGKMLPVDPVPLGDIIFACQTIDRESKEMDKSFRAHFIHLLVHGTLHLLGYTHDKEATAHEMETVEIITLNKLGIENPYSEANFMA